MSFCELEDTMAKGLWCVDHGMPADRRTSGGTPVCQTYYDNIENYKKQAASVKKMTVPLVSIVDGVRHVIGEARVEEVGIDPDGRVTVKGMAFLDPEADIEIIAQIHPLSKILLDTLEWAGVTEEKS